MALYKPKNLKPSITNGPVNMDITKGGEFSFQLDGNEPIENFTVYIQDPNGDEYLKFLASKQVSYYNTYLDLEDIGPAYVIDKTKKETYIDNFRTKYPIFDANINKTSSIFLRNLPTKTEHIKLTNIYYQHQYRWFYETGADIVVNQTANMDIILPEEYYGLYKKHTRWIDSERNNFPCINPDRQELVENKRVESSFGEGLPIKINSKYFGDVGIEISLNSQQFFNALFNPIAKDHFKETNPFLKTYYKTFGVFDWIFLKFECKIGESVFYYIKGFIPNLNTEMNKDIYYERYFFKENEDSVLKINKKPSKSDIFRVYYTFDHWTGAGSEYYETLSSCGDKNSSSIDDNFEIFFNNSTKFYFKDWNSSQDSLSLEFTLPNEEVIELSDNNFNIDYISYSNSKEKILIEDINIENQFGYPINSRGENNSFNLPFDMLSNEDSDKPLIINNYNIFYNGSKQGFLNWYILTESSKNKVVSSKESFFWSSNPIITLSVGNTINNNKEIIGFKNIPVNVNISYPEIANEDYELGTYNETNIFAPNFLIQYTKDGEKWKGVGDIYYKFKSFNSKNDAEPEKNCYFLVRKEFYNFFIKNSFNFNESFSTISFKLNTSDILYYDGTSYFSFVETETLNSYKLGQIFLSKIEIKVKNDNGNKHKYLSLNTLFDESNSFRLSDLRPDLLDISYYKYSIKDNLTNKIIKNQEAIYTGDLNFSIDFLPEGNYTLFVEIENIMGIKGNQSISFEIKSNQKNFNKKPTISLLNDTGIYLDWKQIPFLQAYFSKGNLTENNFFYNYPVKQDNENSAQPYNIRSLEIPNKEKLQFNLMGQECDYLVYCFQTIGQEVGVDTTKEVMIIKSDPYWYKISVCMIDQEQFNTEEIQYKYKYSLNIKAINKELEQISPSDSIEKEETFITFLSSNSNITSNDLFYILLFDKKNNQIYFKIYENNIYSNNVEDTSLVEVLSTDWKFFSPNVIASSSKNDLSIKFPKNNTWEQLFQPLYIELLGHQVCSYLFGTNDSTISSIDELTLTSFRTYNSDNGDIFSFNPNKNIEDILALAEDKTEEELANVTVIRRDKTNNISKIVLNQDSYTNNFIDYSTPSKIDCYYEIYLGNNLDQPYTTETINTDDLGKWFLFICDDVWDENGLNENKVTVSDIYEFEANVTVGQMSNNTDFSVSKNFTRYPKVQHSPSCYWSGTLGGLLGVINKAGTKYTQTTEMLNKFKQLTIDDRRKFLKDRDGNIWEVSLSAANTVATETKLNNQLKTANISWVEVADTSPTMIYLDNINDATWLQEETVLVTSPYNGRTQF